VRSQLARDGIAARDAILKRSRFGDSDIGEAIARLVADKQAVIAGNLIADFGWWQTFRQNAIEAIDEAHRAHPEHSGLPLTDLRANLQARLSLPEVFDSLVRDLCQDGFKQAGTTIGRVAHRPALPPHLAGAGARVRAALSAKLLDPPSVKELAPDAASQQALRFLLQTGEAVELNEEVVLLAESFTRASEAITIFLKQHSSATAGELRQALGTSRRIIIPLLERMDKKGVTRREGDKRVLKKA
jgi:selenocysteine-specific elongation factor